MLAALRNRAYARLFAAQVLALVGTGLLTVALGLLAVDVAGNEAGIVMGTALTIRIVAFVTISPVMSALVNRLPRTTVLVGLRCGARDHGAWSCLSSRNPGRSIC